MAKNIYSKPYSYYQNPHPGAVPYSPRHAKKALEPEQHIQTIANEDQDFQMRVNAATAVGVYYAYPLAYWRTDSSHGKDY